MNDLAELLSTPVVDIDPSRNEVTPGPQRVYLEKYRKDALSDGRTKHYCQLRIAEGADAGRVFFNHLYPKTKAGGDNPVFPKHLGAIVIGALGSLEAVAGLTSSDEDVEKILTQIAEATPPLAFTVPLKNERWNDKVEPRFDL